MSKAGDESQRPTSVFSSIRAYVNSRMDEQKIERLQRCRVLEKILSECLEKKKDRKPQLEDVNQGKRILRYFDWLEVHDYDETCQREVHAVWACRGLGLSCGSDLAQLRDCFISEGRDSVLSQRVTAYDGRHQNDPSQQQLPCETLQQKLGACVAENAAALETRRLAALASKQD